MSLANEIIYGSAEGVSKLLNMGANPNEIDVYGYTPLIQTAIMNKPDIAALLIDKGADVDAKDLAGRTPLHWAADNHNLGLCKLFLEQGANANAYSLGSEPILVHPLLREQTDLKQLLYRHGADLNFTQDFINAKLLSHRFELHGFLEIVNAEGKFIELDLEGFFLEFTLSIIANSLHRYRNHFSARHLRQYFPYLDDSLSALRNAALLNKYKHYMMDIRQYADEIDKLLNHDPLILPIGYEGHAITFIRSGNCFIKCDRGEFSKQQGSVIIYKMHKPQALSKHFLKELIYKRQSKDFIEKEMTKHLGLMAISHLPIESQIIGNCSWANVEATIPAIILMRLIQRRGKPSPSEMIQDKQLAMYIHNQWTQWDQDTALYECIYSFYTASPARKAAKASLLAAILFQKCNHRIDKDIERAEKILQVLTMPDYRYVLQSYIDVYAKRFRTKAGKNLMILLDLCGVHLSK